MAIIRENYIFLYEINTFFKEDSIMNEKDILIAEIKGLLTALEKESAHVRF